MSRPTRITQKSTQFFSSVRKPEFTLLQRLAKILFKGDRNWKNNLAILICKRVSRQESQRVYSNLIGVVIVLHNQKSEKGESVDEKA